MGSATISECGNYRYTLERKWPLADDAGHVLWVMLNPSTADAATDDPTITRCIGYSKAWGFAGLMVGNLYGYRATDPAALWEAKVDIRGNDNDQHLCRMAAGASLIVAAWGGFADHHRAVRVISLLKDFGSIYCIGKTKGGQPWHPLYKAKGLKPIPYAMQDGAAAAFASDASEKP